MRFIDAPHVGITGARGGWSEAQGVAVRGLLRHLREHCAARVFHHGDCVGVDAEAAKYAKSLGYRIVGHPPTDPKARAFFPSDELLTPKPYLNRNRGLVDAVNVLIGAPRSDVEKPHGGTWATIRYGRRRPHDGLAALLVIGRSGSYLESRYWQLANPT